MGIIIAVKHSPPEAAGEIVDQQVRLAINELRRLVSALRPADLEELGVSAALEQYVITLTGPRVPRLIAELDPIGPHELAWNATIAVFRVAQEALRNVIRHATAGQVRVTLRRHARAVTLNVSDNGVGFEATQGLSDLTWQMTQAQHFGLANMIEWAASVRGELIVTSAPGQGTQVRLRVPLAPLAYAWQSPTQSEGRGPESETP
jgi:signal transduction histidine kinase